MLVALREILLREGYQVMTHNNPLQALEALKKETFSVIITDQQMPMLTGLEFLAQARRLQPDATRILITAVLNLDTVIDAINKGEIYRFVVKPWLREELLATLKSAVQRYELTCRNQILQASALSMNEKLRELNASLERQVARVAEQNEELERLNVELAADLQRTVDLCGQILQKFSPVLGLQARRIHDICSTMADVLNLAPADRQLLEAAGSVCNLGFVGLPREVLRNLYEAPDELTNLDRQSIEQHPILGQEILQPIHRFVGVGEIVRAHHEQYDGGGYPDHLKHQEIPWLARLLAVAASFAEARNQGPEELEILQAQSGSAFDPEAVSAFCAAYPALMGLRQQQEVSVSELRPGMVLAKGIYTASGSLLLPEGQQLTESNIGNLRDHSRANHFDHLLLVTC